MCDACKDTGIYICTLDNTNDTAIQRCDHCKKIESDQAAIKLVETLVYGKMKQYD